MSNFLITGGAGFIGSRLAKRLVADGHRVAILDNFHAQVHTSPTKLSDELEGAGILVHRGDICDGPALSRAMEDSQADVVVHLAAETGTGQSHDLPVRYCETNVTGTAKLIEAVRASSHLVSRVVLASSRAVYGEGACVDEKGQPALAVTRSAAQMQQGDFAPKAEDGRPLAPIATDSTCPPNPMSVYASTKLMQEYLLQQAFQDSSTAVGILRLQNVYGPGQSVKNPYTGVLSIFFSQLLEGKQLNIYEDGDITRDFVFVDDVVSAIATLATITQLPNGVVDIGSGHGTTILEVAREMTKLLGLGEDRIRISGDFRPGDIRHAVSNPDKAIHTLSWRPTVSVQEGIAALLKWIRGSEHVA